jgi:hypothetical protein
MDQCEVSVMIPFDPTEPWSGFIIGSEPDTGVELMVRFALTSLCEDHLACYCSTAYRASPDSELGEPHMAAAS